MQHIPFLGAKKLIDCTQLIDPSAFTFVGCFPNSPYSSKAKFGSEELFDTREQKTGYRKCVYSMACDVGTHIDSPAHWFHGMRDISEIPIEELIAPGVVIDVTIKVEENPNYQLSIADVTAWEEKNGKIPPKALVCMKTGWSKKFHNHSEYMGLNEDGSMYFPGFSAELAKFLISTRDIVGIGIDTASLDAGTESEYPVHDIILGANKYQIENMVLEEIDENDKIVFVSMPIKVKDAPEAEARVIATVY